MDPLIGILWYGVFVISTTVHEAAHAFVALKLGDRTAYEGGQVTLDPIPHIRRSPFGMVVVPILCFVLGGGKFMIGWASAPYDPFWAQRHPRRAALMALAGPIANLALVLVAALVIRIGVATEVFLAPDTVGDLMSVTLAGQAGWISKLAILVSIFFSLNLLLFVFNLFPLPPLDGSAVIVLFFNERIANRIQEFTRQPMFAIIGLLVALKAFPVIYGPVRVFAVRLLYWGVP